jgi:hypothetical protein
VETSLWILETGYWIVDTGKPENRGVYGKYKAFCLIMSRIGKWRASLSGF